MGLRHGGRAGFCRGLRQLKAEMEGGNGRRKWKEMEGGKGGKRKEIEGETPH